MKDYLLVYRTDYTAMPQGTPEQMAASMTQWMDWINSIAAQDKLTDRGNRLDGSGKVVRSNNVITDGPYTDIKESIGGYSLIKANSYNDAVEIATGCPIFLVGGNVEVREIVPM